MGCNTVKNKRLAVCQQIKALGFLHAQDECDNTYCSTGLHTALQDLGGEGEVRIATSDLQLYKLRCQKVVISLRRVPC